MLDIKTLVEHYGGKREKLLPVLQEVIKNQNYLSEDAIAEVAKEMKMSPAEVFGVASFYSFLDVKPRGENVIRICKTITCDMAGKEKIIRALEEKLKIRCGDTTPDNKFSLTTTNCIGWCHKGPAMLINDNVYTELTPEKAVKALEEYL